MRGEYEEGSLYHTNERVQSATSDYSDYIYIYIKRTEMETAGSYDEYEYVFLTNRYEEVKRLTREMHAMETKGMGKIQELLLIVFPDTPVQASVLLRTPESQGRHQGFSLQSLS
jgi:hypothetical protein